MIKIIAGVYGHNENGIINPKDVNSAPFSLSPEREAELVAIGVAEYANVIIPDQDDVEADSSEAEENANDGGNGSEDDNEPEKPKYNDRMKLSELQKIAKRLGIDTQELRTKADVIKVLDDYFEESTDTPPTFGAIDPVE